MEDYAGFNGAHASSLVPVDNMSETGPNNADLKELEEKTYYDISNNVPASVRSCNRNGGAIFVAPFPQIYETSNNMNPYFRHDVSIRPSFQTYSNIQHSYYPSPQSVPNFQRSNLSSDCQPYRAPNHYSSACHPSTFTHSQRNFLQQQQFRNATLHRETMPLLFNGSTNYLIQSEGIYAPPESNNNAWHPPEHSYYSRGYNNSWQPPPNVNPWANRQVSVNGNGFHTHGYTHCSTTSNPAYVEVETHAHETIPQSKPKYVEGSIQNYAKTVPPNVSNSNENTFTVSLPGGQALFSVPLQPMLKNVCASSITNSSPANSSGAMNVAGSSTRKNQARRKQNYNVRSVSIGNKVRPVNSHALNERNNLPNDVPGLQNSFMQNRTKEDLLDNVTNQECTEKSSTEVITIDISDTEEMPQTSHVNPSYPNGATEELTHAPVLQLNTDFSAASLQNTSIMSQPEESIGVGNLESQESQKNITDLHKQQGESAPTPCATQDTADVAKATTGPTETNTTGLSFNQNGSVLDMPDIFNLLTPEKNISNSNNPIIQEEELFEVSMSLLGDLQQDLCLSESENEAENEDAAGKLTGDQNATDANSTQIEEEGMGQIQKSMDNGSDNSAGNDLEMGEASSSTTTEVHICSQSLQHNEKGSSRPPNMDDEDVPTVQAPMPVLPFANSSLSFQAPSVMSPSSEEDELLVDETMSKANEPNSSMQNEDDSKSEDESHMPPRSVGLPSFHPSKLISRLLMVSKSNGGNEEKEMQTRRSIFSPDIPLDEQEQAIINHQNPGGNDQPISINEITLRQPTSSSTMITSDSDLTPNSATISFGPDLASRDHAILNHDDLNYHVSSARNTISLNQNASSPTNTAPEKMLHPVTLSNSYHIFPPSLQTTTPAIPIDTDANNVGDYDEEICFILGSPSVSNKTAPRISNPHNGDSWTGGLAHYQAKDTRQKSNDHSFWFSNSNNSNNAEASASSAMDLRINCGPFSGLDTLADVALGTGIAHNLAIMSRAMKKPGIDSPLDLTVPKRSHNFRPLQNPSEANFFNSGKSHVWQSTPPTQNNLIAGYNKGYQPHTYARTRSNYYIPGFGCLPPLNHVGNSPHANLGSKSNSTPYSERVVSFVQNDHFGKEAGQVVPKPLPRADSIHRAQAVQSHAQSVGFPVPMPDTRCRIPMPPKPISAATYVNLNTPQLKPNQFMSCNSKMGNDASLPKAINGNVDLKTRNGNKRSSTPNTSNDEHGPQAFKPNRMSLQDETGKRVIKRIARASKPILSNSSNLPTVQSIRAKFRPLLDHVQRSNKSTSNAYKQRSASGKLLRRLIDRYRKPGALQTGRVRSKCQRELNQVFKLGADSGTTKKSIPPSRRIFNKGVQELMKIPPGPFERRLIKKVRQNSKEHSNNAVPPFKKLNTTSTTSIRLPIKPNKL